MLVRIFCYNFNLHNMFFFLNAKCATPLDEKYLVFSFCTASNKKTWPVICFRLVPFTIIHKLLCARPARTVLTVRRSLILFHINSIVCLSICSIQEVDPLLWIHLTALCHPRATLDPMPPARNAFDTKRSRRKFDPTTQGAAHTI